MGLLLNQHFWIVMEVSDVVGWCMAPLGEWWTNLASQYLSFGFTCATAASPGRSGPPWVQLEGWSSHRGKSMSSSVTVLNVKRRTDTLQL